MLPSLFNTPSRRRPVGQRPLSLLRAGRLLFAWHGKGTAVLVLLGVGALLGASRGARAQATGAVAGVVVNEATGETLPGANVRVMGTERGTSTGVDGRYRIEGLAPGSYAVAFSFVSYRPKTVTGVEVRAGRATTLDVTLKAATQELNAVVVTAEAARNSEAGLLRERQKAAGVSNAISAEAISASGSSDAADAMAKVTGASITEGKYVNVRGLGGRYVNTTLNGAALPSADPDENAVPFDLFPAGLLERIVVSKTFTPDKAGNFTGGSVDIGTVAFPSDLELRLSSSAEYNTEARFGRSMVGFSKGMDAVPADGAFDAPLVPATGAVPVDQSYDFSFGNEFSLFGDRPLGVVATASYDKNVAGYTGGVTARYKLANADDRELSPELNLADDARTVEDLYSGAANLSLRPFPKHELGVNLLYTRGEAHEGRFQQGFSDGLGQAVLQTRTVRQTTREVRNLQVRGEHAFGAALLKDVVGSTNGFRLTWNAALTRTDQDEPDYRQFANDFYPEGVLPTRTDRYKINVGSYTAPARYFRSFTEDGRSADATLNVPLASLDLKVGGSYTDSDRTFRQRLFRYDLEASYEGHPQTFFNGTPGVTIQENTRQADNYDGARTVSAAFLMADVPLGALLHDLGAGAVPFLSGLRVVGGARVERTDQCVTTAGEATRGRIETTDWLPSLNLTYGVTDQMNVRAAYGRTLARPSFREFAPVTFQPFIEAFSIQGNPRLERTLVDNYDLRWEWFLSPGDLLAVSSFYKNFSGPIVRTFVPIALNPAITYSNASSATVYGAELEARHGLGFLAGALQNVKAGANLTLAHSSSEIPDTTQSGTVNVKKRRFQGQSDYLVNANLAYENPASGTSAGFHYNVFGKRLTAIVRGQGEPPRFEQPRHTLDFTLSQRLPFGLRGLRVKVKAKNLLGARYEVTRELGATPYTVKRHALGRSFTLGLQYSL